MRAVVTRVSMASVEIGGEVFSSIGKGYLVLAAWEEADSPEDVEYVAGKIARLRIWPDSEGKMNLSIAGAGGAALVVSQFTLYADTAKGNRPSFIRSAKPETAIPMYERFVAALQACGLETKTGKFAADMKVASVNDGPVTIIIDSKNRSF